MTEVSVFLAHSKSASDAEIQTAKEDLQRCCPGAQLKITTGKEDWEKNFSRIGTWDGWARHVAQGTAYGGNLPFYNVIVCLDEVIGKATADIVGAALDIGKPVKFFRNQKLEKVIDVYVVDAKNYKNGWKLVLK